MHVRINILVLLLLFPVIVFGQKTKVEGVVKDQLTGDPMPFVSVRFQGTKVGALTDTLGKFSLESYYATDTLVFTFSGYLKVKRHIELDESQVIDVTMPVLTSEIEEVVVRAPDELPSTILHKKVVRNKPINNKEKLDSYEYEVYNKVQLDLNNIGDKFKERKMVQRLDVIMEYLDSVDGGKSFLPVILSESVSDYYYNRSPRKKREIVKATRISGVENIELNQFLGDMYLDLNVYDNSLNLFNKSFISPVADYARSFYRFYLEDSMFIDQYWCYKLTFKPKRTGDMTFVGEMWIHDTTYAVKRMSVNIAPWANINYVQDLFIEHEFEMVAPEVWMLKSEKMFADLKLTKETDLYGLYGRRYSSRKNFVINNDRPPDFYQSNSTVEIAEGADERTEEYWNSVRHKPLSVQEDGIDQMIDTLNTIPFFKTLKRTIYMLSTGYYPAGKLEYGDAFQLFSFNPVETFRLAFALRTSNEFSKRIELGGKIAYGFGDKKFKYGATVRYNITPKKRGMLSLYYFSDIEQIGQSPTAAAIGSTFGTLLRTGPLDKLTFVEKAGIDLEKDVGKDFILFGGFEWKEYRALGVANYIQYNPNTNDSVVIDRIQTTEFTARFRWAKNEEFISGTFDRKSVRSKFPIISIQGIFGIKDLLGGDYDYQKLDLVIQQTAPIGVLGRIKYGINFGYIFGTVAYPFLKVHEGNQSYWLMDNAFNKMNFFEFISDKYIGGYIENHWDGLFFDRIPLIKKAKLRLVTTMKAIYGQIHPRHRTQMILPSFTKEFGDTPYVEVAAGIENIFTFFRVDVFWRLTHLDPGVKVTDWKAFGIRTKYVLNF